MCTSERNQDFPPIQSLLDTSGQAPPPIGFAFSCSLAFCTEPAFAGAESCRSSPDPPLKRLDGWILGAGLGFFVWADTTLNLD